MHHFAYRSGMLSCEDVSLADIAGSVRTPTYVYSYATVQRHFRVFDAAFGNIAHLVCFSAKANTSGAVLAALGHLGAGADIVSGGELFRARRAGIDARKIVFSGVGKQAQEIEEALRQSILLFNVESEAELVSIDRIAARVGLRAPVALRVNPDVDPKTHPYIATGLRESKFGVSLAEARGIYEKAKGLSHLDVCGIDCHIGSQLTSVSPFLDSMTAVAGLARELYREGVDLRYFDIGGGLGIRYADESPPTPDEYGAAVRSLVGQLHDLPLTIISEPGRVIMGNAGVLLTRVLYVKHQDEKCFIIVDAAMNDLVRPSLYGSFHDIWPVSEARGDAPVVTADVVGPICESGDFLARGRKMALPQQGDLLALMSAGAYGFAMSSSYNSRPRAAEALVHGDRWDVIRTRETYEDLIRGEQIPPWLRSP